MPDQNTKTAACAERFDAACKIIVDAGKLALDYFERRGSLAIEMKTSGQDLVSAADRDVEDFLRQAISARFPEDGLYGEENGQKPGTSHYRWLMDPIDGTSCFLHGLQSWGVVIALFHQDTPVAGLIYEPCTGQLYTAKLGEGAHRNGTKIHVNDTTPFSGGFIAVGATRREHGPHIGGLIAAVMANGGVYMRNGSAALSLAHVAAGHYLAYYEPVLNAWDCVAGLLIVSEAGGDVDDFPLSSDFSKKGPCLAGSAAAAEKLRDILGTLEMAAGG
ncbi:inositol monophosphatase family protein [Martelella mangrovi]|uniref:Myo-inositol-1(Or 4)-monophosphatase n=1 Tax=Martelella mangrovi TaxID=1397477 RepID=A0ABV2I7Q6_9HYPH